METKIFMGIILALVLTGSRGLGQSTQVTIAGAMRNVMWKGELQGTIDIDTISNKSHLFGLGPQEYLTGELLILDGEAFRSTVVNAQKMKVEEIENAKAPFFVYANESNWKEIILPASVTNLVDLEKFIDEKCKEIKTPFVFKLEGMVDFASIHIVNLPKGKNVASPDDAHQGKTSYGINKENSIIVGFFSREHQGVFTHHDTFLHMHLITADKQMMGHLDDAKFDYRSVKLFLPDMNL